MGYLTLLGCLLIAFGPLVVFFVLFLARKSTLVLLAIGAGFSWLFGMFVSSMFWDVLSPLRGSLVVAALLGVVCTEASRFLFWLIWTKGRLSLNQDAGKRLENETVLFWEAVAAGVGCGFCSSLMFATLIWDAFGPGVPVNQACFGISVYVVGAIATLMNNVLQVLWNVFAHRAYRNGSKILGFGVVVHHGFISVCTVFNSGQFGVISGLCMLPIVLMFVSIGVGFFFLGRNRRSVQKH